MDKTQMHIGFARLLYPFFAGVLLMRLGKKIHVKGAFFWCSLMIVVLFSVPRFGGPATLWMNGIYESVCILILFPLIVLMGAGDTVRGTLATKVCKFFGEISYPLYITHYPLIYWYTEWVIKDKVPAARGAVWGVGLFVAAVAIAYGCLKLYDEPVREWLRKKVLVGRVS